MKAEIITIGDEILIGQTIDTNSAWIGHQLNMLGMEIDEIRSIPDERVRIMEALSTVGEKTKVVFMTGGLGPTQDDITKQTIADFFSTDLVRNEEILTKIRNYFESRGREVLPVNEQQADLPEACEIIPNELGTASGMWFEDNEKIYISMPGVPYEMKGMMEKVILPRLSKRFGLDRIYHRTILTVGVGESSLAKTLEDWETRLRNSGLSLAYLPSPGIVKLRITCKEEALESKADKFAEELYDFFGPKIIWGEGKRTLPQVVGEILKENNKTVATAESCSGGKIAKDITSVSGSSAYYLGSIVSYANAVKVNQLGVSEENLKNYGAVSEAVVREMAEGGRETLKTDYCIATSGVAGPDGGTEEKPVGLVWIAVSGPDGTVAKSYKFGFNRERNIQLASIYGLNMLRKVLINV